MERNLRKTRQGVVVSNKMEKTIVVAAKFKEKNTMYTTKRTTAMSATPSSSWKLVL